MVRLPMILGNEHPDHFRLIDRIACRCPETEAAPGQHDLRTGVVGQHHVVVKHPEDPHEGHPRLRLEATAVRRDDVPVPVERLLAVPVERARSIIIAIDVNEAVALR